MKTIIYPSLASFDFRGQLKGIVDGAPQSGYTISDVRIAVKIVEKLEASDEEVALEDTEYNWLKDRVENTRWASSSGDVLAFVDAIENAR